MGRAFIRWTPPGDSEVTAYFPGAGEVALFGGGFEADVRKRVTAGGVFLARHVHTWAARTIERRALDRNVAQVSAEDDQRAFYAQLTEFWADAAGGELFAFGLDKDLTWSSTLSAAADQGDGWTTDLLAVTDDPSDVSVGDALVIIDADNPKRFGAYFARGVDGPGKTIQTASSASGPGLLNHSFASGSTIRHAWYFPKCTLSEMDPPIRPRSSRQGNAARGGLDVYDLRFTFREVP